MLLFPTTKEGHQTYGRIRMAIDLNNRETKENSNQSMSDPCDEHLPLEIFSHSKQEKEKLQTQSIPSED